MMLWVTKLKMSVSVENVLKLFKLFRMLIKRFAVMDVKNGST